MNKIFTVSTIRLLYLLAYWKIFRDISNKIVYWFIYRNTSFLINFSEQGHPNIQKSVLTRARANQDLKRHLTIQNLKPTQYRKWEQLYNFQKLKKKISVENVHANLKFDQMIDKKRGVSAV